MNRRRFDSVRYSFLILGAATLYLALSGFQCASTEMTTAKVALQRKDYNAAEEALKKEVAQRPMNADAWKILGDLYYDQKKYAEMDKAYTSALAGTTPPLKDADKQDIAGKRFNAWAAVYKSAVDTYNEGIQKNNTQMYQQALVRIDTAIMLRPGYPENVFIRATLLGVLDREQELQRAYSEYIRAIEADVEKGTALGLTLGMTPQEVEAKLGKTTRQDLESANGNYYSFFEPRNLYVYYVKDDKSGNLEVQGWRFITEPVPPFVAEAQTPLRSSPYYILGAQAYREGEKNKARYDDALKYLQMVQKLDPRYPGIGQLISEIYVVSGRTAEATALLEQQIRENPNDPVPYIAYGNLLFESKQYQKAADAFRKVTELSLDRSNENLAVALFNLGAVYKNIGADLQDSIRRVTTAPTPAQIEVYRKPLRESAKYFEQRKALGTGDDYTLLAELGNLYDVLGEKAKVQQTLSELERLNSDPRIMNDPQYWRTMSRFYAIMGDVTKAEMADKKATELSR